MRTLMDCYNDLPADQKTRELYWTFANAQKRIDAQPREQGFQSIGEILGTPAEEAVQQLREAPPREFRVLVPGALSLQERLYVAAKEGIPACSPADYEAEIKGISDRYHV